MIVKGKYKYKYSAVNIRFSVAVRFRTFSKKTARSHTDTLVTIMDFFEWHGFLPSDRIGQSIVEELLKNRKRTEVSIARTNATIAIIKDIEKKHDKPTTAMLQSLFQGVVEKEEPVRKEKLFMAIGSTTIAALQELGVDSCELIGAQSDSWLESLTRAGQRPAKSEKPCEE